MWRYQYDRMSGGMISHRCCGCAAQRNGDIYNTDRICSGLDLLDLARGSCRCNGHRKRCAAVGLGLVHLGLVHTGAAVKKGPRNCLVLRFNRRLNRHTTRPKRLLRSRKKQSARCSETTLQIFRVPYLL